MIRTARTAAVTLMTLALLAIAWPATAHTPSGGADCYAVWAGGEGYDPADTNTLQVILDGHAEGQTFGADGYVMIRVPADGVEHDWSWSVTTTNPDPAYSASDHGTITCGTPPPPVVKHASFRVTSYCNGVFLESKHNAVVTKTKVSPGVFRFDGTGKHGALFGNGTDHRTVTRHVKRFGCGSGS